MKAQLAALNQKYEELKLSIAKPHRNKKDNTTPEEEISTHIGKIAKYMQLFYGPNSPEKAFDFSYEQIKHFKHDHPDRYLDENIHFSHSADLYDAIPRTDHHLSYCTAIQNSSVFKKKVSDFFHRSDDQLSAHIDVIQYYF